MLFEREADIFNCVESSPRHADAQFQEHDLVAVPLYNKWVRGTVEKVLPDRSYSIWALDYGIPLVFKACEMSPLPKRFGDVRPPTCRIKLGGIKNCIPADHVYDLENNRMVVQEVPTWDQRAIDICLGLIKSSIRVDLLDPTNPILKSGWQTFGHLRLQKLDGSWIKLSRCLVNAKLGKFTDDLPSCLRSLKDALNERRNESRDGQVLQTRMVAVPISRDVLAAQSRLLPPWTIG